MIRFVPTFSDLYLAYTVRYLYLSKLLARGNLSFCLHACFMSHQGAWHYILAFFLSYALFNMVQGPFMVSINV